MMNALDIARFEDKLDPSRTPDECWLWQGSKYSKGYGYFRMNQRATSAHRASYRLFVGPIPRGLQVLHRCDVRACVNPAHLFLGTGTDNMRDRDTKGRGKWPGQPDHPQTKLSHEKARRIRALKASGVPATAIAAEMGVCRTHIYDVLSGKIWSAQ